jgi:hypothetical protein
MNRRIANISEWFRDRFGRVISWWNDLVTPDQIKLTVWYVYEENEAQGIKTTRRKEKFYMCREILKKSNTHIIARDTEGKLLEIKAVKPFDYELHHIN